MGRTLDGLEALDGVIEAKARELGSARGDLWGQNQIMGTAAAWGGVPTREQIGRQAELHDRVQTRQGELAELKAERSVVARDVPALLRIEDLGAFRTLPEAEQTAALREATDGVLADIAATRGNLEDGDFNLWTVDGVRDVAAAGLGLEGERAEWVADRAAGERRSEALWAGGEAVLGLGLAVAGTVATGGLGVGLVAAGLAVGTHGAIDATGDYLRDRAGSNTALDPSAGLLPEGAEGHWGFVAAAWVGAGLETAAVGSAIRALRAGGDVAGVARAIGRSEDFVRATLDASRVNRFATSVLSDAAFDARYGAKVADAVTVLRPTEDGAGLAAEIVTRRGLAPEARQAAIRHEMAHVAQLADPALTDDMARLTETGLARWADMPDARAHRRSSAPSCASRSTPASGC